jgi:dGTPase
MRALCQERLYRDDGKQRVEIGAFAVLRGLLGVYCDTLVAWEAAGREAGRMPYFHQRTLRLLPPDVLAARSRYDGLLAITDYVSGMTNRFAVLQHRMLLGLGRGGELPERAGDAEE